MLDIKLIRERPEIVKKDLKKRGDSEKLKWVDDIAKKDKEYRELLKEAEELRHKRNVASDEINQLKKQGKDISKKVKEVKDIPARIKQIEEDVEKIKQEINNYMMRLPNIMDESVPVGKDESENVEIRKHGKIPKFEFKAKNHVELCEDLGIADFDRSAKLSGKGFYILKGPLAMLDLALQKFAIDTLSKKGFTLISPPFMMRRNVYEGVVDLADFETMMYKVEGEDLYLIATSEHPLVAMHANEVFAADALPIRYVGVSSCFRKEIGSHGVDEKGLFRIHQFSKVEQIVFCLPEESKKMHEELIANAEDIFKKLEIPYRVVNICTGDLGVVAAKKYDIEAWMPHEGKYKEVVSCSNCTDYQARRLGIKYEKAGERNFLHTLNSTAVATSRAMRAIIENCQQEDGSIAVPKALQPYMLGLKKIEKLK